MNLKEEQKECYKDQQRQITEIRNLALFQEKEKKIDRREIKRLLKEQNEKEEATKGSEEYSSDR